MAVARPVIPTAAPATTAEAFRTVRRVISIREAPACRLARCRPSNGGDPAHVKDQLASIFISPGLGTAHTRGSACPAREAWDYDVTTNTECKAAASQISDLLAWVTRRTALTEHEYRSPFARRPYGLRHACLSTWLNRGVAATQVAEWAGHSVEMLLRVYAKCLDGQDEITRRRITAVLNDS